MASKWEEKAKELREEEAKIQKMWEDAKVFEEDAADDGSAKYMVTFPYPYMNGRLHLGHAFTVSKAEFAVGYQRLRGKKCLFPFGFHCTGMPIKSCADKLKREVEDYGFPPQFPVEVEELVEEVPTLMDKRKGKKSKVTATAGSSKYQWDIMRSIGLSDEEICHFADPMHWLAYFPRCAMEDLKQMGVKVDWRRSFITTSVNPYYDSFVRWQFQKLRREKKIDFGERYTIFSPKDGQPCMDHDRSSGEGVGSQEYTLVKLQVLDPKPEILMAVGKPVFLVVATLRPETLYGLTNCYLHPDIEYSAFYVGDDESEVFVATERAARNMSFQKITREHGVIHFVPGLKKVSGCKLLGCALKAPFALQYEVVYALPTQAIKDDNGTGVVASVPSGSLSDYMELNELKKSKELREKYGIADEMVFGYQPVSFMKIEGYVDCSAEDVCRRLNINSQMTVEEADNGVLTVGKYAGMKTSDARAMVETDMKVMSRSGDECVAALCGQWLLNYSDEEWKSATRKALEHLNTYGKETRRNLDHAIGWLRDHACSRSFGLGTKLPWDAQCLVGSLSDSTIYTAYYTVAHLLQSDLEGHEEGPLHIKADSMTEACWDYVFLGVQYDAEMMPVPQEKLDVMRKEFLYWYPADLRVSGKDLLHNHLPYYLFNHVAVWQDQPELWPQGIRANGHLLINNEKMSKSTGNFISLHNGIKRFSADGMRFCLADAGDTVDDANFVYDRADAAILRLHTFVTWAKKLNDLLREGKLRKSTSESFADRVFISRINKAVLESALHYEATNFKETLRTSFYDLQAALERYSEICGGEAGMREDLMFRFVEVQAIIVAPICPHISEQVWQAIGKDGFVVNASWPVGGEVDEIALEEGEFLDDSLRTFRRRLNCHMKKSGVRPSEATIYIAEQYVSWQKEVLAIMATLYEGNGRSLPDNKVISQRLVQEESLRKVMKKTMPFVQMIREKVERVGNEAIEGSCRFDQKAVLQQNCTYLLSTLKLKSLSIRCTTENGVPGHIVEQTVPGCPVILYT
ncbi:hypothetical protein QR680_008603 [Steinernema hermaphroditum]|uniref:leucine--tRNA ligase n=1 Tax=Steinernema hermaphroditum TaxID=289476 RepID=A0AA39IIK1_9BILA|nr:hypothetical protein QR680_008603 [Steinernema hermaphroditum]